jgi:signal transduction histidine kinase
VFELGVLPLEKKLQVDVRQHLFLFFKEAITNIAKHSNAIAVTIRFGQFNEYFELSIHDDGTTAKPTTPSSGFGLQNMEIRANKLGAQYDLNRDHGFRVSLKMKSL